MCLSRVSEFIRQIPHYDAMIDIYYTIDYIYVNGSGNIYFILKSKEMYLCTYKSLKPARNERF